MEFALHFNDPAQEDWRVIISELEKELPSHRSTIFDIFCKLEEGYTPIKQKGGCGRKLKLQADDPGLAVAALALNGGMSQEMAMQICNQTNKHLKMAQEYQPVTTTKFMSSILQYTNVKVQAVL